MISSLARLQLAVTLSTGIVSLADGLVAQDVHPHHREKFFLERVQDEAGRLPYAWKVEGSAPAHRQDLRTTALGLLALLGDGSTIRSGPARVAVKKAVLWLLARRDARGRLAHGADRAWLLDHAIATYALLEAARLSTYKLMHNRVQGPLRTLVAALDDMLDGAPDGALVGVLDGRGEKKRARLDPELQLWCSLCARSAKRFELWWRGVSRAEASWSALPEELAKRLADRAVTEPRSERARAAAALETLLREPASEANSKAIVALASAWPEDAVRDPLAVLYLSIAMYRLAQKHGAAWAERRAAFDKQVARTVVKAQERRDAIRGSWTPTTETAAYGRVGLSSVHTLTVEVYYRYCRLEVVDV